MLFSRAVASVNELESDHKSAARSPPEVAHIKPALQGDIGDTSPASAIYFVQPPILNEMFPDTNAVESNSR